jgi:hypothetical protein
MFSARSTIPSHVSSTNKGEEEVQRNGPEHGRREPGARGYRTARDATSINPTAHEPIDPAMPSIPPQ